MSNKLPQESVSSPDPPDDIELEFSEHLIELGERFRSILKALFLSSIVLGLLPEPWTRGLFTEYSPPFVITVTKWLQEYQFQRIGMGMRLFTTGPTQVIGAYVLVAIGMGILVSWPVIVRQIYLYIRPAMYEHERSMFRSYFALFLILFWGGCALSFLYLMPVTFQILVGIILAGEIQPIFTIDSFIGFLFFGVIGIGLAFTFPIFSTLLVYAGIYDAKDLRSHWREAITALFIVTALMTPDPTPFTTTILFIPMAILYYLAILMAERVEGGADAIRSRDTLIKAALLVSADQTGQSQD